ncbi:MAG: hypothetical protein ABI210_10125 [Abditibacteriaceae bacterium]
MMKKIFPLLLASSLVFGLFTNVKAQPSTQPPPIVDYSPPGGETPEQTIINFFMDVDGQFNLAANMVAGADPHAPALQRLQTMVTASFGQFRMFPGFIKITIDPKNPDITTANYPLVLQNNLYFRTFQADSVKLKRYVTGKRTYWMIIPQSALDSPEQFYKYNPHDPESGLTMRLASLIAYPQKSLTMYNLVESQNNVQQIIFGLLMYEQDSDNKIDFTPKEIKGKLMIYLKALMPHRQNDDFFTAPGDTAGTMSYSLNPNLIGINDEDIKNPSTVVVIYQGQNQKLDYKYGNYSVVGFADGHVKWVTPEEAKGLRWKP